MKMANRTSRRQFLIASTASVFSMAAHEQQNVQILRTPDKGVQPQAVIDSKGVIHLIYLYGDPAAANIAYVRKGADDQNFTAPIVVNSPGSAIAIGRVEEPT